MIMKKTLLVLLFFICFGTPCFGMDSEPLFSMEKTEWDIGEGFSIGFYRQNIYLCDSFYCKSFPGTYRRVSFKGSMCISNGSCTSVSGLVFPLWGIGVMPRCTDNNYESGLIVKISDSFGVILDATTFFKK